MIVAISCLLENDAIKGQDTPPWGVVAPVGMWRFSFAGVLQGILQTARLLLKREKTAAKPSIILMRVIPNKKTFSMLHAGAEIIPCDFLNMIGFHGLAPVNGNNKGARHSPWGVVATVGMN
jgi:hypothetical protein